MTIAVIGISPFANSLFHHLFSSPFIVLCIWRSCFRPVQSYSFSDREWALGCVSLSENQYTFPFRSLRCKKEVGVPLPYLFGISYWQLCMTDLQALLWYSSNIIWYPTSLVQTIVLVHQVTAKISQWSFFFTLLQDLIPLPSHLKNKQPIKTITACTVVLHRQRLQVVFWTQSELRGFYTRGFSWHGLCSLFLSFCVTLSLTLPTNQTKLLPCLCSHRSHLWMPFILISACQKPLKTQSTCLLLDEAVSTPPARKVSSFMCISHTLHINLKELIFLCCLL
jgi:hypothetical protein